MWERPGRYVPKPEDFEELFDHELYHVPYYRDKISGLVTWERPPCLGVLLKKEVNLFTVNSVLYAEGLKLRKDLNDKPCFLISPENNGERWKVRFSSGAELVMKHSNMSIRDIDTGMTIKKMTEHLLYMLMPMIEVKQKLDSIAEDGLPEKVRAGKVKPPRPTPIPFLTSSLTAAHASRRLQELHPGRRPEAP